MLRLDKIHPEISGNKPLKLAGLCRRLTPDASRAPVLAVRTQPFEMPWFMPRAVWNIPAFYWYAATSNLPLTPTLQDGQNPGAKLVFWIKTYARRYEPEYWQELEQRYQALVIPEGGAGELVSLAASPWRRWHSIMKKVAGLRQWYDDSLVWPRAWRNFRRKRKSVWLMPADQGKGGAPYRADATKRALAAAR